MSLNNAARAMDRRESVFEDRTLCHADHVGDGLERRTTAAVGLLKALDPPCSTSAATDTSSCSTSLVPFFTVFFSN